MSKVTFNITFGMLVYLSLTVAAQAAGKLRYREPTPNRIPSIEEYRNDPCGQGITVIENQIYFVDAGHIFKKNLATGEIAFMPYSQNVKSILSYRGQLVALVSVAHSSAGTPYLWDPDSKGWLEIVNSTRDLYVIGEDLVAHTQNNQLWIYEGESQIKGEPLIKSIVPVSERWSGVGTAFSTLPSSGIAFFDSKFGEVRHVAPICENGKITDAVLTMSKGRKMNYSQLRGSE